MKENKETSTEWLFQKLWDTPKDKLNWYALFAYAKQLEKEQIKIAFNDGRTWNNSWRSEEYFEELYSKENDKEN